MSTTQTTETTRTLTIADTAALTGLSPTTLRYYERIGLIDHVERTADGHRRYRQADLAWLAFLLRLRTTAMPIRQMLHFARLRRGGQATVRDRLELLRQHEASVRQQHEAVMRSLAAISDKIVHYEQTLEEKDEDPGG